MSESEIEITPEAAAEAIARGARLVDVREAHEWRAGAASAAEHVPAGEIERNAQGWSRTEPLLLMCAAGRRSLIAAKALRAAGFTAVRSVVGGYARWQAEGRPVLVRSVLDADARERYARHLALPGFDEAAQQRLARATVVLVGAGGLGCPAAAYLVAAGVGRLILHDDDRVERSNLQRQILHAESRIGEPKVESAAQPLRALNPRVGIVTVPRRVTPESVTDDLAHADLVIDGTDSLTTRYVLNDACVARGIPLVYGAVHRHEGQVAVFWPAAHAEAPCYRCLFPEPPPQEAAPNCATAGVLGVAPGLIGVLQATEALKLLASYGTPLVGRLLQIDLAAGSFRELRVPRDPDCAVCAR